MNINVSVVFIKQLISNIQTIDERDREPCGRNKISCSSEQRQKKSEASSFDFAVVDG